MTSMSMDELDERDVLRLSLWFVSIVSLLLFFCSALNAIFLIQESEWKVWKVLSDCDMVYAIERERWIRSLFLHRRIRDCVVNGARMFRIEI